MSYPTRDDIRKDKERNILRLRTRLEEKRRAIEEIPKKLAEEIETLEAELEAAITHYTTCWPDHLVPE